MNNGKLVPVSLHVACDNGRTDLFNVWVDESIYEWLVRDLSKCELLTLTSITSFDIKRKK